MKPPRRMADARREQFCASHRVREAYDQNDTWQWFNPVTEEWEPVAYDDVPDEIWKTGFKRDGWTFYTDRTRPTAGGPR